MDLAAASRLTRQTAQMHSRQRGLVRLRREYPPEFGQESTTGPFAISETHHLLIHEKMAHMHKQPPSPTIQLCSSTCLGDGGTPKNLRSGSKSSWVVIGRRAARGSAPHHRDPHEVASKAAQKPRSTAAGRSEDRTLLSTPPKRPTSDVFPSILDGVFKPILHKNFAEWPTGRPARKKSLCIRRKPSQTKARPRCAGYCA